MTTSLPPKSIVLYADDDPDDRALLKDLFLENAETVELLTFPDGLALENYLFTTKDPKPCLIILDIQMPFKSGLEVLSGLRQWAHLDAIPVVIFSTSSLPSEAATAHRFGASLITKPLNRTQLDGLFTSFLNQCTEEVRRRIHKRKNKG